MASCMQASFFANFSADKEGFNMRHVQRTVSSHSILYRNFPPVNLGEQRAEGSSPSVKPYATFMPRSPSSFLT